tara:strand:+ start:1600 stop:3609 length:2010 start_codon:yes stop_codon:yes gene_type:complete
VLTQFSFFRKLSDTFQEYRFPAFAQWQKLPRLLSSKERVGILFFLLLFFGSSIFLLNRIYVQNTVLVPTLGGSIKEGMVGSPRFLNPLYADTNDIDRSLTQLLFSGILRYDNQGNLAPDLAARVTVLEGGKVFEIDLKQDARWHDGYGFGADDVVFTVQTLQDPRYKSPVRANWVGVQVEKISPFKVRFLLQEPYAAFQERLTLKILPLHIWEDISPENFALSLYNVQPVGTGPYRFIGLERDKSGSIKEIQLKANKKHHLQGPYIESLTFRFFETEQKLLAEADTGKLQSFPVSNGNNKRLRNPALLPYEFSLPRSFNLFFNLKAKDSLVTELNARMALRKAIDKEALVKEVFKGQAFAISSPLRPDLFGFSLPQQQEKNIEQALLLLSKEGYRKEEQGLIKIQTATGEFTRDLKKGSQGTAVRDLQECLARDSEVYPEGIVNGVFGNLTKKAVTAFQEKYASDILQPVGLSRGTGTVGPSTRAKLRQVCASTPEDPTPLTLTITTLNQSPLPEVAAFLAAEWEELGIVTNIQGFDSGELERDVIKPREYEMLLFGEILGRVPDPLPYWHSAQKKDPGLNLSGYENKTADNLLEQAREQLDETARNTVLEQLQDILLQDVPALFLYDLPYRYVVIKEVKGVEGQLIADPSQRFAGILDWYIKTKRQWR